jgi:chromosome segregation ATPase
MRKIEEIIRDLPENIRGPIYEAFVAFRDDIILKETREIKAEIGRVWEVIKELAESQKRTEQEIEKIWGVIKELAEAQKRTEEAQKRTEEELASFKKSTEENFNKVWGAIRELAEAQKRTEEAQKRTEEELASFKKSTEENFNKVWSAIRELAEAQKRTEERLESFKKTTEENFNKVWNAIRELTEAQKRTEERLNNLIEEHRKTREKLEGLSDSFGYLLEDRAIKSLPKILKENYDIEVVGKLKRDYFIINREHIEVNIFGKVKKGDEEYTLLGEAKSRVSKKEIDKFIRKCEKISKEAIKILISYVFSPEIKKYAHEKGIILIHSYELEF